MNKNDPPFDLNEKIREERQLIAEQKWIIKALKKIKNQRNALQIERLQLENMKREFIKRHNLNEKGHPLETASNIPTGVPPSDQTLDSEMATPGPSTEPPTPQSGPSVAGSATDHFLELEATCNIEVLNLEVAKPLLGQRLSSSKRKFFEGCKEEEEEIDNDEMTLDMNIFMNCSRKQ